MPIEVLLNLILLSVGAMFIAAGITVLMNRLFDRTL